MGELMLFDDAKLIIKQAEEQILGLRNNENDSWFHKVWFRLLRSFIPLFYIKKGFRHTPLFLGIFTFLKTFVPLILLTLLALFFLIPKYPSSVLTSLSLISVFVISIAKSIFTSIVRDETEGIRQEDFEVVSNIVETYCCNLTRSELINKTINRIEEKTKINKESLKYVPIPLWGWLAFFLNYHFPSSGEEVLYVLLFSFPIIAIYWLIQSYCKGSDIVFSAVYLALNEYQRKQQTLINSKLLLSDNHLSYCFNQNNKQPSLINNNIKVSGNYASKEPISMVPDNRLLNNNQSIYCFNNNNKQHWSTNNDITVTANHFGNLTTMN